MARAMPGTGVPTQHEMQLQLTAKQTVDTMTSSLKLLLARIQKFTSHTFHVFIRDLIPGAKDGRSLLFTRIVEHRNQYLAKNRSTSSAKPYSALDTLTFIQSHFVQENENAMHISWTAILLHTRDLLQPLYQWQASFDPLTRKYEQAKSKAMSKVEFRKMKCLISKQITDEEKVILAGIDTTFTIENIDKGDFLFRTFQEKLAANASRFQSKKYTPDSRILTYLKVRAQEFNVPVPSFMRKRSLDKGKGQQNHKRGRSHPSQSRMKGHQVFIQQSPSTGGTLSATSSLMPQPSLSKGNYKGKGKATFKGQRSDNSFSKGKAPGKGSTMDGAKGLGKGKGSPKGKGKSSKGKGNRAPQLGVSSHNLVCDFCHLHGHISQHCRKRQALHNSASYQQARSQFDTRQQLLIDQLENSLFAPNACSWCLQSACTHDTCYPPEDPEFYAEVTHFFQESLLPYVQNAKLCLPIDNSVPLMPQHFAFDGTDWGHHTDYDQFNENHDWDQNHDHDDVDHFMCEESNDGTPHYGFDDADIDQQAGISEYEVVNTELHLLQGESSSNAYSAVDDGGAEEAGDSYYAANFEDSAQ
jgi:hypothetical protein